MADETVPTAENMKILIRKLEDLRDNRQQSKIRRESIISDLEHLTDIVESERNRKMQLELHLRKISELSAPEEDALNRIRKLSDELKEGTMSKMIRFAEDHVRKFKQERERKRDELDRTLNEHIEAFSKDHPHIKELRRKEAEVEQLKQVRQQLENQRNDLKKKAANDLELRNLLFQQNVVELAGHFVRYKNAISKTNNPTKKTTDFRPKLLRIVNRTIPKTGSSVPESFRNDNDHQQMSKTGATSKRSMQQQSSSEQVSKRNERVEPATTSTYHEMIDTNEDVNREEIVRSSVNNKRRGSPITDSKPKKPKTSNDQSMARISDSEPMARVSNVSSMLRASNASPMPRASNASLMPRASNASPMPRASNAPPILRASNVPPMPRASNAPPIPRASDVPLMPRASNAPPMPRASNAQQMSKASITQPMQKAINDQSKPEVQAVPRFSNAQRTSKAPSALPMPRASNDQSMPRISNARPIAYKSSTNQNAGNQIEKEMKETGTEQVEQTMPPSSVKVATKTVNSSKKVTFEDKRSPGSGSESGSSGSDQNQSSGSDENQSPVLQQDFQAIVTNDLENTSGGKNDFDDRMDADFFDEDDNISHFSFDRSGAPPFIANIEDIEEFGDYDNSAEATSNIDDNNMDDDENNDDFNLDDLDLNFD